MGQAAAKLREIEAERPRHAQAQHMRDVANVNVGSDVKADLWTKRNEVERVGQRAICAKEVRGRMRLRLTISANFVAEMITEERAAPASIHTRSQLFQKS